MEKIQEYQAPKCDVMELQNEGAILSASLSDIESGGTIGSATENSSRSYGLDW